jgi:hypothetical protein
VAHDLVTAAVDACVSRHVNLLEVLRVLTVADPHERQELLWEALAALQLERLL